MGPSSGYRKHLSLAPGLEVSCHLTTGLRKPARRSSGCAGDGVSKTPVCLPACLPACLPVCRPAPAPAFAPYPALPYAYPVVLLALSTLLDLSGYRRHLGLGNEPTSCRDRTAARLPSASPGGQARHRLAERGAALVLLIDLDRQGTCSTISIARNLALSADSSPQQPTARRRGRHPPARAMTVGGVLFLRPQRFQRCGRQYAGDRMRPQQTRHAEFGVSPDFTHRQIESWR